MVNSESLKSHIIALQENIEVVNGKKIAYRSRSSYNRKAIRNAEKYIVQEFSKINSLRVEIDEFGGMRNIVATLPANSYRDDVKIYIICAHYDSKASKEKDWNPVISPAPGADDNASGVAAMLEIAKILGLMQHGNEIRFIAFDAEEIGMLGSKHYVELAKEEQLNIEAVINLDMIGYNWNFNVVDVITNHQSSWIADYLPIISEWYELDVKASKVVDSTVGYGDHKAFWNAEYDAVMLVENAIPFWSDADYRANEFYHTYRDTYDKVNFELVRKITQLILATVYQMANSSDGQNLPKITVDTIGKVNKENIEISGRLFSDTPIRIFVEPNKIWAKIDKERSTYSANIELNRTGDNFIEVTAVGLYGERKVQTTVNYVPEFQFKSAIVYPNPFNPLKENNVVFRFEGNRQVNGMKVFMYTSNGSFVRYFRGIRDKKDSNVWRTWWNGKIHGESVSSGIYLCVFEIDVEGSIQYNTVKLAVIR